MLPSESGGCKLAQKFFGGFFRAPKLAGIIGVRTA
jgi:hypothetical protein